MVDSNDVFILGGATVGGLLLARSMGDDGGDGNGNGNGDGNGQPTYNGVPRADYTYCGAATDLFDQWVAGEITTQTFQTQTGSGNGTAALTLEDTCPDGNGDGNGNGNGNGEPELTCSDHVASAQEYADGAAGCADDQWVMACPMGDATYTAVNTCERNWLQNQGWTVESEPEPDPEPVEYTFQVLSDSPTEVLYSLHVGVAPTALGPPAVEERYQAETADTVEQQYVSETIQQLSDGTWLVEGRTGSADGTVFGDSFAWTTADHEMYGILGWEANQGTDAYSLEANGTEINPNSLPLLQV